MNSTKVAKILYIEDMVGTRKATTEMMNLVFKNKTEILAPQGIDDLSKALLVDDIDAIITDFDLSHWFADQTHIEKDAYSITDGFDVINYFSASKTIPCLVLSSYTEDSTFISKHGQNDSIEIKQKDNNSTTFSLISPFLERIVGASPPDPVIIESEIMVIQLQSVDTGEGVDYDKIPVSEDLFLSQRILSWDLEKDFWMTGNYAWNIQHENDQDSNIVDESIPIFQIASRRRSTIKDFVEVSISLFGEDQICNWTLDSIDILSTAYEELESVPDRFKNLYQTVLTHNLIAHYINNKADREQVIEIAEDWDSLSKFLLMKGLYQKYSPDVKAVHEELNQWPDKKFPQIIDVFDAMITEVREDEGIAVIRLKNHFEGLSFTRNFSITRLKDNGVTICEHTPFEYTVYNDYDNKGKWTPQSDIQPI